MTVNMRSLTLLTRVIPGTSAAAFMPLLLQAETWKEVPVVDSMCYEKVEADPDAHTTQCARACAGSGYCIIAVDSPSIGAERLGTRHVGYRRLNGRQGNPT